MNGAKTTYEIPFSSNKRPFTETQDYKKLYQVQQHRTFGSRSQERTYQDKKQLSKLFRKAGVGRFSQHIPNYKSSETAGDLYSWGRSQDGVLGHEVEDKSDDENVKIDKRGYLMINKPKILDFFKNHSIKISKMSCGAGHIVVLANNTKIYSWGWNRLGQLGLNIKDENISIPSEITNLRCKNIINVYWGAGHSFALDSYGSAYSWGASADYQTGHGQNEVDIYSPKRIDFQAIGAYKIVDIACGIKHTLMLTANHEVISFGWTEYGQWGQGFSSETAGKKVHNKKPAVIQTFDGRIITNIYWGGAHSMWLTSNQAIYSFGLNNNGQLGLGSTIHHINIPEKLRQFTSFSLQKIACGDEMTLFLTSNSDLFACGWNGANQFACIESPKLYYPTQLNSEQMFGSGTILISQIYCSDRTIAFKVGLNKLYQCGSIIGKDKNIISEKPMLIKELEWEIQDVIWARSQMFVIGTEKQNKGLKTNEHIMNILNNNQFFYTQKPKEKQISFQYSHINKRDLK